MQILQIQTIIDAAEKIAISQSVFAILFILVNTMLIYVLWSRIKKYEQLFDEMRMDYDKDRTWYRKAIEELIFKIKINSEETQKEESQNNEGI